jgi:hypothetical protein
MVHGSSLATVASLNGTLQGTLIDEDKWRFILLCTITESKSWFMVQAWPLLYSNISYYAPRMVVIITSNK